jgi:hypothetical protein
MTVHPADAIDAIDRASVGVLGLTAEDLTPRAIAVTPYVIGGEPVVTTTLALLGKAKMLRNRLSAALLAGGIHVGGNISVVMHEAPEWFDEHVRDAEARKYPPAKSLLSIPFHRRLLWWYVGRAAIAFDDPVLRTVAARDRVTLTSVVDRTVEITPLADDLTADPTFAAERVELGAEVPDGPGCLLVHDETDGMAELLSLTLRGDVSDGVLAVTSRHGSLEPRDPGTLDQLRSLRDLGRTAKANRATIDAWSEG